MAVTRVPSGRRQVFSVEVLVGEDWVTATGGAIGVGAPSRPSGAEPASGAGGAPIRSGAVAALVSFMA